VLNDNSVCFILNIFIFILNANEYKTYKERKRHFFFMIIKIEHFYSIIVIRQLILLEQIFFYETIYSIIRFNVNV